MQHLFINRSNKIKLRTKFYKVYPSVIVGCPWMKDIQSRKPTPLPWGRGVVLPQGNTDTWGNLLLIFIYFPFFLLFLFLLHFFVFFLFSPLFMFFLQSSADLCYLFFSFLVYFRFSFSLWHLLLVIVLISLYLSSLSLYFLVMKLCHTVAYRG